MTIERELTLIEGAQRALRNEQLFVDLVGGQRASHLPPHSPQPHSASLFNHP